MILLSTSSLTGYGLHKIFDFAKKSGYDGIDLAITKSNYDMWDGEYLTRLIKEFWVPVASMTIMGRGMNEKKVDQIISIATKIKAQMVTFSPPHFSDKNTTWFTKYLGKIKRDTHLTISIQNVEPKFIFFLIPEHKNSTLFEIKRITGDTTLDLSSIDTSSGMDILKAQKMLGSSVKNIFLSDKHGSKSGILPGTSGGWVSYLPLESFLLKLKTTGYNGFITLKVRPSELGAGNNERVLQNLEYAKNYYEKHYLNYK